MSDVVIRVEGLGKKFKIGSSQPYHRLSEVFVGLGQAALRFPGSLLGCRSIDRTEDLQDNSPAAQGEFWALKDINFEVKQGEVVGVIGRNGAGKSTLLKILSRITEPTEGRFGIKGRVASLLEVGTGFHPELTGRENVFLSGSLLGMSKFEIKRKFDEIIDFAGTEKFLDTPVKRYSSGMQVRLGFAIAAHLEPEILIVDEVLAVGDAEFQKKCLGKMGEVSQSGRTVLFVSHNLAAVRTLCTSGVLLSKGTIQATGRAIDCLTQYSQMNQATCPKDFYRLKKPKGVQVTSLRYYQSSTQVAEDSITCGESLTIAITCERLSQDESSIGLVASIAVKDHEQTPLLLMHSRMTGDNLTATSHQFSIDLSIPRLPLRPGRYFLTISLMDKMSNLLDSITEGPYFDVIDGPHYVSCELPPRSHALLAIDHEWSLHQEASKCLN